LARYVVGLDAGTTAVKAFVYDEEGAVQGSANRELLMHYPGAGMVEQDAADVALAAIAVLQQAVHNAAIDVASIAAIGITNQRSSIIAWDGPDGRPLAPMIIWQDIRAAARCEELQAAGLYVTPMMAASKAEWIVANSPEARAAALNGRLRLGTPNSWLLAALCGDIHVSDHGNASPTGFYDYIESRWDPAVLKALGIEESWLPTLVDTSSVFAELAPHVLGRSIPVASMLGDQQASLFGLGCSDVGMTKCSFGTSAMVDSSSGSEIAMGGPGTYPVVGWALDGKKTYTIEGQVITAGAAVQWLRDGLGIVADASETSDLALSVPDSGGVWAVPALQGLGTPALSETARALVGGLSRSTTKAQMVRAALEGIAQRVVDAAESVWVHGGPSATLRADGGGSLNPFLMQTTADLLGVRVETSATPDGAAFGAAKFAGLAVGMWDSFETVAPLWKKGAGYDPAISDQERTERRTRWGRRLQLCLDADD
jgi:glycerol kinase